MGLDVKGFSAENVAIKVEDNMIYISGTIDDVAPGKYLMPFFKAVNDALIKRKIKEIKVDCRNLSFINSAGIKEIVLWVMKATQLDNGNKYKIIFICNPEIEWQTESISKVSLLAPALVETKLEPL